MKIFIESLEFVGSHGLYDYEKIEGRTFRVDLSVDIDTPISLLSDHISNTVDYRALAEIILEVGKGNSVDLIETLSKKILDLIFKRIPNINFAEITIRKKATGVPGDPLWVGVSLTKERDV